MANYEYRYLSKNSKESVELEEKIGLLEETVYIGTENVKNLIVKYSETGCTQVYPYEGVIKRVDVEIEEKPPRKAKINWAMQHRVSLSVGKIEYLIDFEPN